MGKIYPDDDPGLGVTPNRRWLMFVSAVFIPIIIIVGIVLVFQPPLMSRKTLPVWCYSADDYHHQKL